MVVDAMDCWLVDVALDYPESETVLGSGGCFLCDFGYVFYAVWT